MDTSIPSASGTPATDPSDRLIVGQATQDPHDQAASVTAWASLLLGIAGLLPVLPFVGSVAAIVTGAMSAHAGSVRSRHTARAGLTLGILGVSAPLVFLFVYCVVLGYPFPIHRYQGR